MTQTPLVETRKISEVLKAARELITDPKNWTQRHFARDCEGLPRPVMTLEASCFCSFGAIRRVSAGNYLSTTGTPAGQFLNDFCCNLHGSPLDVFNDFCTHKEVLELFDKAIEEAIKHE